jgi:hypothetical protein
MRIFNMYGEEIGVWSQRIVPVLIGEDDRTGFPAYRFDVIESPVFHEFPDLVFHLTEN